MIKGTNFCFCYYSEGGTNFGFMNGGNAVANEFKYQPTVTSYGMLTTE